MIEALAGVLGAVHLRQPWLGGACLAFKIDIELAELSFEVGDRRGCAALSRLGLVNILLRHFVGKGSGAHRRHERHSEGEGGQSSTEALTGQPSEAHGTARSPRAMGQAHKSSVMSWRVALMDASWINEHNSRMSPIEKQAHQVSHQ